MGGRADAGYTKNKANLSLQAKLDLKLRLSLAISKLIFRMRFQEPELCSVKSGIRFLKHPSVRTLALMLRNFYSAQIPVLTFCFTFHFHYAY